MPRDGRSLRDGSTALIEIEKRIVLSHHSEQSDRRIVILIGKGAAHPRESAICRIKRARFAGKSGSVKSRYVGDTIRERVDEAVARAPYEAQISSELQSMFAFRPGNVIHQILDGRAKVAAPGHSEAGIVRRAVVVESAEEDNWRGIIISWLTPTLPRVAPMKVVQQRWADRCRVANRESLAVVSQTGKWNAAGKIGRTRLHVVAQSTSPEQAVIAICGELVIHPSDIPVAVGWNWATETIAEEIESIPLRVVIGMRERLQVAAGVTAYDRVRTDSMRVQLRQVLPREAEYSSGNVVNLSAHPGDRSSRALRCVRALVLNNAVTKSIAGHNTDIAFFFALTSRFVIGEEVKAVLDEGTANRSAEDVADQFRSDIGFAALNLRRLHKVVVGAGIGIAEIFIKRTVKTIGAAFGDERDLGARRASRISTIIRGRHAEFLHGIESDGQNRRERIAVHLIVDIDAIEGDVRLIAVGAVDGTVARVVGLRIETFPMPVVGDTSLQRQQIWNVAPFHRKLLHLNLIEGIADRSV